MRRLAILVCLLTARAFAQVEVDPGVTIGVGVTITGATANPFITQTLFLILTQTDTVQVTSASSNSETLGLTLTESDSVSILVQPPPIILNLSESDTVQTSFTSHYNESLSLTVSESDQISAVAPTGKIAGYAIEPTSWVNVHEPDAGIAAPDVTITLGQGGYTNDATGLNKAFTNWCAAADQAWLVKIPAGTLIHGPITGSKALITVCAKTNATKYIVVDSTTPLPDGQTVCSHGLNDYPNSSLPNNGDAGYRNPLCNGQNLTGQGASAPFVNTAFNDIASMYTLRADSTANAGSAIINCAPLANHFVFKDMELTLTPNSNPSKSGSGAFAGHPFNCDSSDQTTTQPYDYGLQKTYCHGFDPGDTEFGVTSPNGDDLQDCVVMSGYQLWATDNYIEKIHDWATEGHSFLIRGSSSSQKIDHNWVWDGSIGMFWDTSPIACPAPCNPAVANGAAQNPNNVEVRRNRFGLNMAWRSLTGANAGDPGPPIGCGGTLKNCPYIWGLKNRFELKQAQKFLMRGNIIDGEWSDGQNGDIVLWNMRVASGGVVATIVDVNGNPLSDLSDLLLDSNVIRNSTNGVQTDPRAEGPGNGGGVSKGGDRWTFVNNLFYNIGDPNQMGTGGGSRGKMVQLGTQGQACHPGANNCQGKSVGSLGNCAMTRTSNVATASCPGTGTGYDRMGISKGDFVQITTCTGGSMPTTYVSPQPTIAAPWSCLGSGSNTDNACAVSDARAVLSVNFTSNHPDDAGGTICQVSNASGWGNHTVADHNTVIYPQGWKIAIALPSGTPWITPFSQGRNNQFTNNMVGFTGLAGFSCNGIAGEGSNAEACLNTPTLSVHHNVFAGRTGSNYTTYNSTSTICNGQGDPGNCFPANAAIIGSSVGTDGNGDGTAVGAVGLTGNFANSKAYTLGQMLIDPSGGAQVVTTAGTTQASGTPSWHDTDLQTTTSGTVTFTNFSGSSGPFTACANDTAHVNPINCLWFSPPFGYFDFHSLKLLGGSPFAQGGQDQASDSKDQGVDFAKLDTALTEKQYTCQKSGGGDCGTGSVLMLNDDDDATLWSVCYTGICSGIGGTGTPTGVTTQVVSSPSKDGTALNMAFTGQALTQTNVLWSHKFFPADPARSKMVRDFQVQYTASGGSASQLEFDQFIFRKPTNWMFGMQCDFVGGFWNVWNQSAQLWVVLNGAGGLPMVTCTTTNFAASTWHHIIQTVHICGSSLCFDSLTVDSTTYTLNVTEPAGANLPSNFANTYGVQQQMNTSNGATLNEYLDSDSFTLSGQTCTDTTVNPASAPCRD